MLLCIQIDHAANVPQVPGQHEAAVVMILWASFIMMVNIIKDGGLQQQQHDLVRSRGLCKHTKQVA